MASIEKGCAPTQPNTRLYSNHLKGLLYSNMSEKENETIKLLSRAWIAADEIREAMNSMKALTYMINCVILQIADGCTPADQDLLRSVSDLADGTTDRIENMIRQKLDIIDSMAEILADRIERDPEEVTA